MKISIKKTSLLFSLIFICTSCTTTKILIVQPDILHFETPETSGGFFHGTVDIHMFSNSPKYEYGRASTTDFLGDTAYANQDEKAKSIDDFNVGLSLGIIDKLDFFTRRGKISGIKYQFLGSSRGQLEKGWKASLSLGFGNYSYIETDDFLGSDDPVNLSSEGKSIDYNINTGYRYNNNFLTYINVFKNKTDAKGTYTSTSPSTASFSKERSHHAEGILFGLNFMPDNKHNYVTLEVGYAKSTWSTLGSKVYTPVGISIGYFW